MLGKVMDIVALTSVVWVTFLGIKVSRHFVKVNLQPQCNYKEVGYRSDWSRFWWKISSPQNLLGLTTQKQLKLNAR